MRKSNRIGLVAVCAVGLGACAVGITPSLPFHAQEGAPAVKPKITRVDIGAGGGGGSCCGWGGSGGGGALRIRHGVGRGVEVGGSVMAFGMEADGAGGFPRDLWLSSKLDVKLQVHRDLALNFGAGGGISPRAGFLGGDIALLIGRAGEGLRRVAPYGQVRASFSGPVGKTFPLDDADPSGSAILPGAFLLASAGILINLAPRIALALEGGGGAIIPMKSIQGARVGGAGYGLVGVNLRL